MTTRALQQILGGALVILTGWSVPAHGMPNGDDDTRVYPPTQTVDQVDEINGTSVADPYRWLEDLDSPETAEWVAAQNKLTFGYLESIPARQPILDRLTELFNYEKYGVPFKEGGRYFYTKNDGLQPQSVLYVAETLDAEPRVLLNPNTLSQDGTVALNTYAISDNGKLMAYGLSDAGSDWVQFHVRNVDTSEDLPDLLKWVKFSGASWTKDSRGFYYSRYDEPASDKLEQVNYYQKLYYHVVGTPQSDDVLVFESPEHKDWGVEGSVSEDGHYLIITITQGTEQKTRVYYQDLRTPNSPIVKLLDDFDALYAFVGNDGPLFWFQTDLDAPRGRLIAIDTQAPDRAHWQTLIPQSADALSGVGVVNDMFIAAYLHDAQSLVRICALDGQPIRDVTLPGIGSAIGFSGKRTDRETFYAFTSFNRPTTIYRYDMATGESTVFRKPNVDINPDDYTVKQVFYASKDGTRVPMFIVHKTGLRLNGNNPTLLYGYGGFNIPLTPRFAISRIVWLEMGGVYAMPNLRGGGEYGKEWHDAGRRLNKQNTFDDFIAAAEWLIANKYTAPEKLAISGASNGGLLVGACLVQRPDLYGAALPGVGVLDMLRYHKFTIGWAWASDYGSPDDPNYFPTLLKYSPLHNVHAGTCYPAVLATTADHDDRVVPSHSFKFISTLQAAQSCKNPILIRIETRAGHGAGKPTQMALQEVADEYAFLTRVLHMRLPERFTK